MSHARQRKGFALIAALVALATVTLFLTVVTVQIVSQRRLLTQRHHQLQADWLTRAGVELASAKLLQDAVGFKDEQTDLAPDSKLHIEVVKSGPELFVVTINVQVGRDEEQPVRRALEVRFRRIAKDGVQLERQ